MILKTKHFTGYAYDSTPSELEMILFIYLLIFNLFYVDNQSWIEFSVSIYNYN